MDKDLTRVQIEMKALGLPEQKVQAIIRESLNGRQWSKMSRREKKLLVEALEKRILFARKLLKFLACRHCWK